MMLTQFYFDARAESFVELPAMVNHSGHAFKSFPRVRKKSKSDSEMVDGISVGLIEVDIFGVRASIPRSGTCTRLHNNRLRFSVESSRSVYPPRQISSTH
jgi:hypothetical protein